MKLDSTGLDWSRACFGSYWYGGNRCPPPSSPSYDRGSLEEHLERFGSIVQDAVAVAGPTSEG